MTNITNEEWRLIPGLDGLYSASSFGRIRSEQRTVYYGDNRSYRIEPQKIKKLTLKNGGKYFWTRITCSTLKKNIFVHQLVAWAFCGEQPKGYDVCHINGDALDNRPENLRYGTRSENIADSICHGTFSMGERHPCAKFATKEVIEFVLSPLSAKDLAKKFNTSSLTIQKIRRGDSRASETEAAREKIGKRNISCKFTHLSSNELNALKDLSISQRKCAAIIGVPQRTIWRWRRKLVADQ